MRSGYDPAISRNSEHTIKQKFRFTTALYTLDQEIGIFFRGNDSITTSHRGSKDLRAYWTWNAVEERKSQVTEVRE